MQEGVERRQDERIEVLLPVDYYTDRSKIHRFHLASNVSSGGAYIHTSNPFKIGDELDVILSLFGDEESDMPPRRISVHGQVRHICYSPATGNQSLSGMGVQWLDMDTMTWEDMRAIVRKQLGLPPEEEALRAQNY